MSGIGFTISSDGTSNKHLDYTSRHINVVTPNYSDSNASLQHKTRFLGISNTVNHTSDTQFNGWKSAFSLLTEIFNNSPLNQDNNLTLDEFAQKLSGLNTDHAEDQKKLCRLLGEWKLTLANLADGKHLLTRLPTRDILHTLSTAQETRIDGLGGLPAWDALGDEEKDRINSEIYENSVSVLVKKVSMLFRMIKRRQSIFSFGPVAACTKS